MAVSVRIVKAIVGYSGMTGTVTSIMLICTGLSGRNMTGLQMTATVSPGAGI